jgi:RNA polymerase sigma-70 factor (ECF subfamily)
MSTAPELPDPALPAAWPQPVIELEEALRHAAPRLRRYATRRLGDAHEAEEIVQEALLRACQHEPGFATDDDLMAWSTVVTGRLVIDRLRLRTRSVSVAEVPDTSRLGRDTADVVVARDEARAALDALEAMPSRQAAVLWAREVEGLSYDEIADRFDLSEPTVRSLLHRARRTLRREYAARGGTLPVAGLAVLAPWRPGMHSLAKLRHAARHALAPATAGAAALSILGVTSLFGGGGEHLSQAPALRLAPSTSTAAQVPLARTTRSSAAPHAAASPTSTAVASTSGTTTGTRHKRKTIGPRTCMGGSSRQAGLNCNYDPGTPALVVRVPLPKNPTNLTYVGVTSDKVDCTKLPKNRIARCVDQEHPTTSVSGPK